MKRKIYLIQPTYRCREGRLLQGRRLFMHSLAIPALSATIPADWEKQFCLEYFQDIDFDTDAGVVGISCMCSDIFRGSEIAGEFRRRGKKVIFGGATAQLWKRLVAPVADAVVLGHPGPEEMKEVLDDALGGRLRREYRLGMNVDFPFDYATLPAKSISFLPVLASVGCRNHCQFCCTAAMENGQYHLRPIDVVLQDMRNVRRLTRRIVFVDTNLYNDREHLAELCERMIAEDFRFIWGSECTLSVGDDPRILRLLREAGCRLLIIGIESTSQSNLRDMGKPNLVRRYREQLERIRQAGISVGGFFMFGMDDDSRSTVEELFRFVRDARISLPLVNLLTPVPGTALFKRLKAEGRMLTGDEVDFLKQNLAYDTPMYRCYFRPQQMRPVEAEQALLELRSRLCTFPEILRRSLVPDPILSVVLLLMNLRYRSETRAIARALKREPAERTFRGTRISRSVS
jgi:radical SAM superfamily enzyme YgiQ (UPF0313 family)